MQAQMLSYSRSKGVFGGVSLSGASLARDNDDNEKLYGKKVSADQIFSGPYSAFIRFGPDRNFGTDVAKKGCGGGKVTLCQWISDRRTGHPFAASGSEDPSQKIEFVFGVSTFVTSSIPLRDVVVCFVASVAPTLFAEAWRGVAGTLSFSLYRPSTVLSINLFTLPKSPIEGHP